MKIKAAAMLMTLILTAGSFTACAEKTNGTRTYSPDPTKKDATAPVDETVPEIENGPVVETVYTDDGSRRYATDYPIELKAQKRGFFDDWSIWKRQENGVIFLQISNSGKTGRETEIEYLLFWVYDSEEDAKKAYEGYYNESKEFDKGRFWEEGTNWFISEEPGVMDASIVWMNYIEGNVIISADLGTTSSWSKAKDPDTPSDSDRFNRATLKDYVLENHSDIRSYVIDVIMEA